MAGPPFPSGHCSAPASAATLKAPSRQSYRFPSSAGQRLAFDIAIRSPCRPGSAATASSGAGPASLPQALHRRAAAGDAFEPFPQRPGRLDVVAVIGEQPIAGRLRFAGRSIGGANGLVIPEHRRTATRILDIPDEASQRGDLLEPGGPAGDELV